ncbi:hypothetical protein GYMLUDRAFT_72588 [Collybiopsis luxurians FD-317 M1]|uniref:Uncharacterized protein n=1 Tax=Collybiopsis luxurians FD-317 M1 TaxID=944289 RepID=A0A0D0D063_9AGAR|nr:hypothetical protein GYMLUDRAFT_72588 [Collybiopsis luxurians FD-317 M1]
MILTKRYSRVLFLALLCSSVLFFLHQLSHAPTLIIEDHSLHKDSDLVLLPPPYSPPPQNTAPPLFERWKEYERNLSQHAEDDSSVKFVFMKNHVFASGWGNVLQEMLLNTHLAYLSGRSFVFDNYTWDRSQSEYSSFNGKTIPSRVPVSTMLSGPIIGGSFDPAYFNDPFFDVQSHPHSPAVHSEYYERVCAGQKKILDTATIRDAVASWDGLSNLKAWVDYLQSLPDRCVEFEPNAEHIFNIWMFGSTQILTLWPSLSQSPIIRQFSHSPLILGAFERNRHLFGVADVPVPREKQGFFHFLASFFFFSSPPLIEEQVPIALSSNSSDLVPLHQLSSIYPHAPANPGINDTIPGLLVLHIRRGDFEEHCHNLAEWGSVFNGFNSFDDIREQDGFEFAKAEHPGDAPTMPEVIEGVSEEARLEAYTAAKKDYDNRKAKYESAKADYLVHCYPDINQIVKQVRQIREQVARQGSVPLTHIYVMTNGRPPFLAELRAALEADAINNNPLGLPPWESIYTSRDLELGWEERYVAQALDMYVAQRAEVFVGNGFSSLTSNIVILRKANGVEREKTRLW